MMWFSGLTPNMHYGFRQCLSDNRTSNRIGLNPAEIEYRGYGSCGALVAAPGPKTAPLRENGKPAVPKVEAI